MAETVENGLDPAVLRDWARRAKEDGDLLGAEWFDALASKMEHDEARILAIAALVPQCERARDILRDAMVAETDRGRELQREVVDDMTIAIDRARGLLAE